MLTWTWARRLAPFRVQVNAVHPGAVLGTQLARDLALKRGTHTAEVSAEGGLEFARAPAMLVLCACCARSFASCSGGGLLASCNGGVGTCSTDMAMSAWLPQSDAAMFLDPVNASLKRNDTTSMARSDLSFAWQEAADAVAEVAAADADCHQTTGAFFVNGEATVCPYKDDVAACDRLVAILEARYT